MMRNGQDPNHRRRRRVLLVCLLVPMMGATSWGLNVQADPEPNDAKEPAARAGKEGLSEEFIALDLQEAVAILGCVTGRSAIDSILDEIFSRFCIGK